MYNDYLYYNYIYKNTLLAKYKFVMLRKIKHVKGKAVPVPN
jgi:hypothetical protein